MDHAVRDASADFIESLCAEYQKHNQIDPAFYERYRVKRGLRNADGTGVMAGVTQIGNVMGYYGFPPPASWCTVVSTWRS